MRGLVSGNRSSETVIPALAVVAGAALLLAGIAGYKLARSSSAADARPEAVAAPPLLSKAAFQARSGVRIVRVAVTGGGGLVDLRYQVLDPEAAASVHGTQPQLVDEGTGVVVDTLLMDHRHRGRLRAAQTYYLIFNNPGNLVRRGTRVTVQLGAARIAHVTVQ